MQRFLHVAAMLAGFGSMMAAPALAPPSPCASLPLNGLVPAPGGPDTQVLAAISPTGAISCPNGFSVVPGSTPPRCGGKAPTMVQGNPRASCYAALPFGPMQLVTNHPRPIAGKCLQRVSVFPSRGRGVGFDDATVTIAPINGVRLQRMTRIGPTVPPSEDPVQRGCTGPDGRLMKLTTASAAPPEVVVQIALATRPALTRTLVLTPSCPVPPAQGCAPAQVCTSGGSCPPPPTTTC